MNRSQIQIGQGLVFEKQVGWPRTVIVMTTEAHKAVKAFGRNGRQDRIVPATSRNAQGVAVAVKGNDEVWRPGVAALGDLHTPEAYAEIKTARTARIDQERRDREQYEINRQIKADTATLIARTLNPTRRAYFSKYDDAQNFGVDMLLQIAELVKAAHPEAAAAAAEAIAVEIADAARRDAEWQAQFVAANAQRDAELAAEAEAQALVDGALAQIGR